MSSKKDETWVLASAMEEWARTVRQMQERIAELAGQLEQMDRITIRRQGAMPLPAGPKNDPEQPPPLGQKKLQAASKYWAESQSMPPWLPICSARDAAKIVASGRRRLARAQAETDPKMAERAAAVAQEIQGASAAPGAESLRWPAPPKQTPEQKKRKLQAGLKRTSFRMLQDEIARVHGREVVNYALAHMCGTERTAKALREAMKTFLGVYPNEVDAGIGFGHAQGRPVVGVPDTECREYLTRAKYKVQREDGRWAVWSQHVAPGDVGPS